METLMFNVPGMTCGHCESAVKGEIGALVGVASVTVDLTTKEVVVTGIELDKQSIIAAIDEAGFEVASA